MRPLVGDHLTSFLSPPTHTQEPNSLLNGRPLRLRCTDASPSSQMSGPSASYSPSWSPKAEFPTQVKTHTYTHTHTHTHTHTKWYSCREITASEGGESQPSLSGFSPSADVKLTCLLMSEDEVKLTDIVCAGCLCLCRGNTDIHTHTHTNTPPPPTHTHTHTHTHTLWD